MYTLFKQFDNGINPFFQCASAFHDKLFQVSSLKDKVINILIQHKLQSKQNMEEECVFFSLKRMKKGKRETGRKEEQEEHRLNDNKSNSRKGGYGMATRR